MARRSILPLAAVVLVALGAGSAFAQDVWPVTPLGPAWRGPGFYLSWVKIAACWLVFLGWVASSAWVSSDALANRLPHLRWNSIVVGSFFGAFVLAWVIPLFWLAWPLLVIACAGPLAAYIQFRNGQVEPHKRVLTPEHLRHWLSENLSRVGVKIAPERPEPHERGPIRLLARGGPNAANDNVRLLLARKEPGFDRAQRLLGDSLARRASGLLLDFGNELVAVRHSIDGVWVDAEPLEAEEIEPALEAFKVLARLNPAQPLPREEGKFALEYEGDWFAGTLSSQVGEAARRVIVQWEPRAGGFPSLDALGMRTKMQQQLLGLLHRPNGLLLFSAMPSGGLETTVNTVLRGLDRLMRDFSALEAESHRYEEVENVPVTTYKASEKPAEVLARKLRTEPEVVLVRDLVDADLVRLIAKESKEERLMLATIRAKDAVEALLRVLLLKLSPAELADNVTAVLAQRLIRKLCERCKEAYAPPAQVLQQLGIPPGRISAFYRPPEEAPKPCPDCGGLGYLGRTAIFELLVLNDAFRKLFRATQKLDALRAAAAQAGMPGFQEEGLLLVAKGVTSVAELARVLKQ